MNAPAVEPLPGRRPVYPLDDDEEAMHGHVHGVCWAAIAAGALGAAALSLILLMLGVGLGLSSASPWAGEGVSAEAFGVSTIVWLTFTQLAASAMGGYLAGRLRVRWSSAVQTDEVYFRDTAHGFLAWALAALVTAGMLSTAAGHIISGGARAGAMVAGTAATAAAATAVPTAAAAASAAGPGYFVDSMFRRDAAAPAASAASGAAPAAVPSMTAMDSDDRGGAPSGEVGRIFANAAGAGALPPDDARYLGRLVSQRTGLPPADADKRVVDTFNRMQAKAAAATQEARAAADKARKASAKASLWMFISLLIGAFVASYLATVGGDHRDRP